MGVSMGAPITLDVRLLHIEVCCDRMRFSYITIKYDMLNWAVRWADIFGLDLLVTFPSGKSNKEKTPLGVRQKNQDFFEKQSDNFVF